MMETITETYPDSYLEHFLAMYSGDYSSDSLEEHCSMAEQFEGNEYITELRKEIDLICINKDQQLFIDRFEDEETPLKHEHFEVIKSIIG